MVACFIKGLLLFGHYQDKLNILDGYRFELSKINPQFGNELRFLRNAHAALEDILHDAYFQNVIFDTETTTLWDKLSDRFEGCVAGFLRNNVPHDMLTVGGSVFQPVSIIS